MERRAETAEREGGEELLVRDDVEREMTFVGMVGMIDPPRPEVKAAIRECALAGIRVAPKPGLLLAWNNMKPDGAANPGTLHEGMPVVAGTKYIVTKWFREGSWLKTPAPV